MTTTERADQPLASLQDVPAEQWNALSGQRIFFGHQSVGGNVMAGVADLLSATPQIKLRVVESREIGDTPAFYHALIGRNEHPLEKLDDFGAVVRRHFVRGPGIAMVKLCFVDIHRDTDPARLFQTYRQQVEALRAENPSLTIVHVTLPLTGVENWKGRLRARLTGQETDGDRNVVRQHYNALLRRTYGGREPVFDIAALESRLPDGRQVFFRAGADSIPVLADQYTTDGGHLNEVARRYVAEQLLITLARVASPVPERVAADRPR